MADVQEHPIYIFTSCCSKHKIYGKINEFSYSRRPIRWQLKNEKTAMHISRTTVINNLVMNRFLCLIGEKGEEADILITDRFLRSLDSFQDFRIKQEAIKHVVL